MKSLARYFLDFVFPSTKAGRWIKKKKDNMGGTIFKISSPLQTSAAFSKFIINRYGENENSKPSTDVNTINYILFPLIMEANQ